MKNIKSVSISPSGYYLQAVSYSLNHVTCTSPDTTCYLIEFRQHGFVKAGDRKSMMNGQLTHFQSLRIVKMEPYSVLIYHAKMAFMQLKKKHLNEFQYSLYLYII